MLVRRPTDIDGVYSNPVILPLLKINFICLLIDKVLIRPKIKGYFCLLKMGIHAYSRCFCPFIQFSAKEK